MKRAILRLLSLTLILALLAACGPVPPPDAAPAPAESAAAEGETAAADEAAPAAADDPLIAAAQEYAGTTLNVTWEAGLQAQDPILFSGPLWEELTGIKINVIEIPFPELYSQAVAEHLAGSGAFDVLNYNPAWIADLATAGVLEPLDSYISDDITADLNPAFSGLTSWGGQTYGLYDDGDVFIMYYRTDLFEDDENRAAFEEQFGRELTPPATWEEWDQVCQFYTERGNGELYGCAIQRAEGAAYFWFMDHFRVNGGRFFDDEMNATINSDVGVATLAAMVNSNQYMPPGVEKWGFVEVLSAWLDGNLAMIITWPPIGRWSAGYGSETEQLSWVPETKIAGNVGYATPPGGHSEMATGFNLGISADSQNKEAAALFIQWLNSPEISTQRVKLPYALRDPFRTSHYEDPEYQSLWDDAPAYLNTLQEAAAAGLNDLSIPGSREYEEALDRAVVSAYAGTDPKEALDRAAGEWDAITERIGMDAQREAYQNWMESRGSNAYP